MSFYSTEDMQREDKKIFFRRFLNDTYTCHEAAEFFSEIRKNSSDSIVETMVSTIWEETDRQRPCTQTEKEQYKKEARLLLRHIRKVEFGLLKTILRIVASTAAAISLIISLLYFFSTSDNKILTYTEICTGFSEKKQISLPDGSMVTLNACSKIRYPSDFLHHDQRAVELQGEGYFNVKKHIDLPFVVSTEHLDVCVLGTTFNVKAYQTDERISVKVEEGIVRVKIEDTNIQLHTQEQITINKSSGNFNKEKSYLDAAVWRKGWLRFDCTPVQDVARELERVYNCRIVFPENEEFNDLISGEHDNQSLESVLKSLEFACGITYKKENNEIRLYKK